MTQDQKMQLPLTWSEIVTLWCWCNEHDATLPEALIPLSKALNAKMDAVIRRGLYTAYKTAKTPQEREEARQKYLDEAGIPTSFRWSEGFSPYQ